VWWSRGSSVSIVSVYGIDDRAMEVRSAANARDFSSNLCDHTDSGAHPASCTMGTGGPFLGVKCGRGMTLTTHPHLVPWSCMSRSYTSSPSHASMIVLWDCFTFKIMWYESVEEKFSVLNLNVIHTHCDHPVSHGTHQVDNPIPAILSPAGAPLWLLPLWWSVAVIPDDHVAGVAYRRCSSRTLRVRSRKRWGQATYEANCVRAGQ
jgi:hypothetical protein